MPQPVSLEQLFGAFVNQGTLEEAAEMMASLAVQHPELEAAFCEALDAGAEAAARDEESVVLAVNKSGYQVVTTYEAGQYCSELLQLFQARHKLSR
jgi:alkanesulfonate monooxygenase SsuD/methylene tetrahydromethanopterin reductase-like flavin-dependent oxidoreductase (luciferase family)